MLKWINTNLCRFGAFQDMALRRDEKEFFYKTNIHTTNVPIISVKKTYKIILTSYN